jgi:flagellar biosynthesis protein FliR
MYIYITKKRKNVFFFIFIMDTQKLKKQIKYTVQLLVSVIVALEIATPPNPYKNQLIVGLTILICLKYNIVERTVESLDRFISQIKKYL